MTTRSEEETDDPDTCNGRDGASPSQLLETIQLHVRTITVAVDGATFTYDTRSEHMTSHRRAVTTLSAAAIIGILAAGCGSDDDANTASSASSASPEASTTEAADVAATTGGDGTLDPCRLVTAGDAANVLGSDPGEPTNVMAGNVGVCTYRLSDGSASVQINVEPDADAAATFESRTAQMGGESVDGVGDQAKVNGIIGQIAVVQGDVLFAIFVLLPGDADIDHATLIELGRAAADRL